MPATRYESAETEDRDNGFFVDAGLASRMDERARDAFLAAMERFERDASPGAPALAAVSGSVRRHGQTRTAHDETTHGRSGAPPARGSDLQIAAFTSGLG